MNIGRRMPAVLERSTTTRLQTDLPTQEDQIRDYRTTARRMYNLSRSMRNRFGRGYLRSLEAELNPDQQLELSRQRRAELVPAEVLYGSNRQTVRHRVYQHYSEQRILCAGEHQADLRLCNNQSYQRLRETGMQHIHLGMFMIRIHTLHRRGAGTTALVVLRDTRWGDDRQIIGTMEIDLSAGTQLIYMIPDMVLSIEDFHNHVQVAIQTHGYDEWQGGESNLLITVGLVGRISNTSYTGFQYSVESVVDHLATNGITAIPGERRTIEDLEGMSWNLKPVPQFTVRIPSKVEVTQRLDKSTSLRFRKYRNNPQPPRFSVDETDREIHGEDEEQFVGISIQEQYHISYEAQKNKRRQDWGEWSTLGEYSGKWDYYVQYSSPPETTPVDQIIATGWDEYEDDPWRDNLIKGKVIIQESEESNEEDEFQIEVEMLEILATMEQHDEKENSKVSSELKDEPCNLELQEHEIDENAYHTRIEKEGDMEYPRLKELEEYIRNVDREVAYPSESGETSVYNPPVDSINGPPVYPPAREFTQNTRTQNYQVPYKRQMFKGGYGEYYNSQWTLPPALTTTGAMLVLPPDPGLWTDVIARWESITLNKLNELAWTDNKSKLMFVENLLGENEKRMWQQWRTTFPEAYSALEAMADDPQNITSQIRQIILMEDPYRGSTEEQDRAYRDLERLTCWDTKNLWNFLNEFRILASKSGRLFFPATTDKFFSKLPPTISKKIEEAFRNKYPGLTAGVLPAIKFTHAFISEMCTEAALQKELRDLSLCSAIPIPGYYEKSRKKYGIRKSRTYKGKPHDKTHIKVFKRKYKEDRGRVSKCKCYICGKEGHFARDCRSKTGNIARRAVVDNLDLKEDWDIVSADVSDQDTVYSISEGEGGVTMNNIGSMIEDSPLEENAFTAIHEEYCFMFHPESIEEIHKRVQEAGSWKPHIDPPESSKRCEHKWQENEITNFTFCHYCGIATTEMSRLHCPECKLTACALCALHHLQKKIKIKRKEPENVQGEGQMGSILKLFIQKDNEWKQSIRDQAKEYYEWQMKEKGYEDELNSLKKVKEENIALLRDLKESLEINKEMRRQLDQQVANKALNEETIRLQWQEEKASLKTQIQSLKEEVERLESELGLNKENFDKLFPPMNSQQINALIEDETHKVMKSEGADQTRIRKVINNQLYNVEVEFDIPNIKLFKVRAIIDTGATSCCINKNSVPESALEKMERTIYFNGLNSRQPSNHKIKAGNFWIEGNKFRIPHVYALEMRTGDGIDMLIGTNFTRSMNGGIRIEGNEVTFYKKVTKIRTNPTTEVATAAIEELDMEEEFYQELQERVYFTEEDSRRMKRRFRPILEKLKNQGYIGEEPLKHWKKNGEVCKLNIINPDITIQDKPLKHVTPALEATFKRHIDALLKIGVIRPSQSRHRTMAMIVNSGTTVDPATRKEVKGKERLVFNYRTLNDNTYKDQYSLPGINTLLKRIGNAKIFSKFDLKSGFHQVAMAEESIEWTAFLAPGGLYEWLVMPFGLKNAPAVFQRKMDKCFHGTEEFIAVYIDDILVYSMNEEEHEKHLKIMLKICEEKGLVLSPTKMKIAVPEIEFLGATIGNSKVRLQTHIIKKICDFDEQKLKSKAGLRSFLGILNYARNYIPKLSLLLGPLYEKTSPHGDKRLKTSDYFIIRKIKEKVQELPDLEIPPDEAYIIIETDGCMEGWGGVCKWKMNKGDSRREERVCAYASGKFKVVQSTIDAEINACINSLEKLKIYYLDKREITLRTDCQAIISFYNKANSNKASRVRWLKFSDNITGTGVQINIEHIDGKQNILADSLSRLVNFCFAGCTDHSQKVLEKALIMIEEILEEDANSRKEKNGSEQITQISSQCLKYLQKQPLLQCPEHYTGTTKSREIQDPSQVTNKMPIQKSLYNWKNKQQEKQSQPCETSKQFWTSKPKSVYAIPQKITSGETTGPVFVNRTERPENSYSNLKPYATNWAASQSNTKQTFKAQAHNLEELHNTYALTSTSKISDTLSDTETWWDRA